jgi:hypothetical protein
MSILVRKKLTGWLILLIVLIGPLQFGSATTSLSTVPDSYRPYLSQYPSLPNSLMVYQLLIGGSIAVWAYTAWVLYQREPGTLHKAQTCFLVGAGLRMLGSFSIALFSGFPPEISHRMILRAIPFTLIAVGMVTVWYLYLVRSERVREIFAE